MEVKKISHLGATFSDQQSFLKDICFHQVQFILSDQKRCYHSLDFKNSKHHDKRGALTYLLKDHVFCIPVLVWSPQCSSLYLPNLFNKPLYQRAWDQLPGQHFREDGHLNRVNEASMLLNQTHNLLSKSAWHSDKKEVL